MNWWIILAIVAGWFLSGFVARGLIKYYLTEGYAKCNFQDPLGKRLLQAKWSKAEEIWVIVGGFGSLLLSLIPAITEKGKCLGFKI